MLRFLPLSVLLLAMPARAEVTPDWRNRDPVRLPQSGARVIRFSPVVGGVAVPLSAGEQCRAAIRVAERQGSIPPHLMSAIARIESGRRDRQGRIDPWPWSINAEGVDHIYESKADAIAGVRALQANGVRSIDVGCMQINLLYHPSAFGSLEQAFDPAANAAYAAGFLNRLHAQTGNWPTATAWYHSATPDIGADYQRKVAAVMPEEQRRDDAAPSGGAVAPWTNWQSGQSFAMASGMIPVGVMTVGGGLRAGSLGGAPFRSAARIIPLAPGTMPTRTLAAYRLTPIMLASRTPR